MKDGREFDDEAHETTDIGRRRFVQGSVASAAGMLLSQHLSAADVGAAKAAASLPGGKRPNFLILMCDENRFPPVYESPQVKDYRSTFLQTQNLLRANGVEFLRHYAAPRSRARRAARRSTRDNIHRSLAAPVVCVVRPRCVLARSQQRADTRRLFPHGRLRDVLAGQMACVGRRHADPGNAQPARQLHLHRRAGSEQRGALHDSRSARPLRFHGLAARRGKLTPGPERRGQGQGPRP